MENGFSFFSQKKNNIKNADFIIALDPNASQTLYINKQARLSPTAEATKKPMSPDECRKHFTIKASDLRKELKSLVKRRIGSSRS